MNLDNIRNIVNNNLLTDDQQRTALYHELAKDKNAVTTVLFILNAERQSNDKLIADLNVLLSKSHIGLEEPKLNKDGFMQKEITEFYKSGRIGHCFKQIDNE